MAAEIPNTAAIDFMLPSPITDNDNNYWDGLHYRMSIADRLANDLAAIAGGVTTSDGRQLGDPREDARQAMER